MLIHAVLGIVALLEIVAALAGAVYAVGVLLTAKPAIGRIDL